MVNDTGLHEKEHVCFVGCVAHLQLYNLLAADLISDFPFFPELMNEFRI